MKHNEISPETRLMLIELAEGFAEGVRKGSISFSDGSARALAKWGDSLLHPEKRREEETSWKNCTEVCELLGVTPPTFRKYVREGRVPPGRKRCGYREPVWDKKDIESFAEWYFSHKRKTTKS